MGSSHHSLYVVLVVVHVVAALVAFGAVALSGVYAGSARHPERPGVAEEASRYFATRAVADWVLLGVPVLGISAVAVGGDGLGRLWVAVALALWGIAAAVVFLVARPARRAVRTGLAALVPAGVPGSTRSAPDGTVEALRAAATRLAWAAGVVDVVFVVAVLDMVYKPG